MNIYVPDTTAISPTVKPISIKYPNKAVPKAVANTINAVVKGFNRSKIFNPYSSAQVDDPSILAKPLDIPTNPKNINAVTGVSKKNRTITDNKSGIFI